MSEMKATENSNEWIDWIEDSISKKRINYYEYEHFNDIQEIGSERFGKVFRVKWKKSDKYLSLKSFKHSDNLVVKELVHELKLRLKAEFFSNIVRFYGITTKENEIDKKKEYLLVTDYADGGNLRNYLKNNFYRLTWDNKYKLAYQLVCAVSYLHEEEIVHLDLHSESILVHQENIKLADFGLAGRIEEASKFQKSFNVPYIDPQRLVNRKYKLNEKSDVYSVGVLLWEISSGRPPFGKSYDIGLIYEISQGARENPIPETPNSYVKIYTACWDQEPDKRPTINEVVDQLKSAKDDKNEKNDQTIKLEREPNTERSNLPSNDINNINRFITSGVVDCMNFKNEIVKPISAMVHGIINEIANKNQERELNEITDRDIFNDHVRNNNVESQQNYDYPLDNQHDSNSNTLVERLNDFGIGTRADREKAAEVCKTAENIIAEVGSALGRDHKKVMGLIKKSTEGAVTSMLQNSSHNDEETVEIIESYKKSIQRAEDSCKIN